MATSTGITLVVVQCVGVCVLRCCSSGARPTGNHRKPHASMYPNPNKCNKNVLGFGPCCCCCCCYYGTATVTCCDQRGRVGSSVHIHETMRTFTNDECQNATNDTTGPPATTLRDCHHGAPHRDGSLRSYWTPSPWTRRPHCYYYLYSVYLLNNEYSCR